MYQAYFIDRSETMLQKLLLMVLPVYESEAFNSVLLFFSHVILNKTSWG